MGDTYYRSKQGYKGRYPPELSKKGSARQLAFAYWRPPEVPNLGKGNSANRRPSPAWARGIPPVGVLPYVRVSTVLGRQTFGSCRMA